MLQILGVFAVIAIIIGGVILFGMVLMASLFLGAFYGLFRGFFFMIQALITDVLGIGDL